MIYSIAYAILSIAFAVSFYKWLTKTPLENRTYADWEGFE